jgi:hypothetical protein
MGAMILLAIAGTAVALAAGVWTAARKSAQRRTEELRAVAERMEWGFREEVDFTAIPDLDRFELFRQGHSRKLSNLATSPPGDVRAVLFDYAFTVSSGKSSHTQQQTVVYMTSDQLNLPSFSLRPENLLHRVGALFGYQDIDLEGHDEFSRLFLLRGAQEQAVRAAFDGVVADFFERRPGSCCAGMGREVLYWRAGRRARPEEIQTLINDGYELARRFTPARQQM